jgi:hypothetical protein
MFPPSVRPVKQPSADAGARFSIASQCRFGWLNSVAKTFGLAVSIYALSVESPERKWIARVQAGVLIVNQIEPTLFQGTAVRFQFSKDESRDRASIFGPDLDDCPILLALFSNGCDLCWQ